MSELDDLLDPDVNNTNSNIGYVGQQRSIPNANAVLVLGIISIVGCFLYAIPGLVCGIIALSMFKRVKLTYLSNKPMYETSYKNANAGYVCAIIGTILSGLYFLFWIFFIIAATSGGSFGRF